MNSPAAATFLLRWKGVESGPFSIGEIRERLTDGDISRLHQVQVNGGWKLLDDFLEQHPAEEREAALRREFETRLSDERARHAEVEVLPPDSEQPVFPTRTSKLAVVALIAGLCCFIPYVKFIAWLPALACGHIALIQIKRDATLGGWRLAVAGMAVTYFWLVLGLTYAVLMISHGRSLF